MGGMRLLEGNAVMKLRELEENSIHAIVTDPPYELGFMGKSWDSTGVANSVEMWRECLRVLKPGGHLLSFGGSRTYHRMACAIEDAGFEIRDQIMWVYGSGFPKSLDVAKSIDKAARGVPQGGADPTSVNHGKYKGGCSEDNPGGRGFGAGPGQFMAETGERNGRELVSKARQWSGWGTALKPAHEPICVARKLLDGTVAANVLNWGTGAVNIDGCRIGNCKNVPASVSRGKSGMVLCGSVDSSLRRENGLENGHNPNIGRWPANLIHDGSDEVLEVFPEAPGQCADVKYDADERKTQNIYGAMKRGHEPSADRTYEENGSTNFAMKPGARRLDTGSAARFFYCAKTSKSERGEGNNHPTVKPIALMRYLCRLVTPPGSTVLDPFAGSGSTGLAAIKEGFDFIGIELNPDYIAIARKRILAEVLS